MNIEEWTGGQRREWNDWIDSKPRVIQDLCRKYPPDKLYRLKTTGQKVTLASYSEDGTVRDNMAYVALHALDSLTVYCIKLGNRWTRYAQEDELSSILQDIIDLGFIRTVEYDSII